jgi:hypothetical protein
MIVKQAETDTLPSEPRQRAGVVAERQMAFYLHRDFANDPKVFVLNDIRLSDPEQPELDGRPGVCQIDHLVLHRWGAFIIESKSVTDEVAVRDDGAGGDEWTRRSRGQDQGFPSPIQQARRQGDFLRRFLGRHRESLLGKMPPGLRSIGKLVTGTDHRGFGGMPIQIIVAISDHGKIRRVNEWKEPTKPFQTFVNKADNVGSKIREELAKHKAGSSLLGESKGAYGLWAMKPEEVETVAEFLSSHHQPRGAGVGGSASAVRHVSPTPARSAKPAAPPAAKRPSPPTAVTGPSCKSCGGNDLSGKWGKYGYYWKCNACGTNTSMPTVCSACGAEGQRGQVVKIRKEGRKFFRACEPCAIEECIWTEA